MVSKRVILADVPPERKTGTRVRSHVPPERKPERGYIRQNHPFTKPPLYLPVTSEHATLKNTVYKTPLVLLGAKIAYKTKIWHTNSDLMPYSLISLGLRFELLYCRLRALQHCKHRPKHKSIAFDIVAFACAEVIESTDPNLRVPFIPLFLMGYFPERFREGKRPIKALRETAPLRLENGPSRRGKRPINANGLFSGTPAMVENGPSKKAHQEVYEKIALFQCAIASRTIPQPQPLKVQYGIGVWGRKLAGAGLGQAGIMGTV